MAITSPASYLPTTDLFIANWTSANDALGAAGPIILGGAKSLSSLQTLRATLDTQRTVVQSTHNELEGARADILTYKESLLERMAQFRGKFTSLTPGAHWINMLPLAYSLTDSMGLVIAPLETLQDLWKRWEDANPPLPLMGGYALADFTADILALKTAYTAHASAENGIGLARGKRNVTQTEIHEILKNYRQRIPSEFPEGSAILTTLPRLSPLPGHTPDAVILNGAFDSATNVTTMEWTAPTDPAVTHVQLRVSIGPEYLPDDDFILGDFPAAGPFTWTGNYGPNVHGAITTFKAYAVTAEGNEHGSNVVVIARP